MSLAAGAVILAAGGPATAKVEGDTITLGSAISLTGKYSTNGENTQRGYDLAVKRVNEMGGVKVGGKTYKIKVVYYDDESTGARAAQLAERLIKQDGIKFMLGPYSSGMTKAVAPVTEKYNVLMVEAEGASRSLFTQGFKNMFAVLSTSEQYLREAIGLAVELAAKEGKQGSDLKLAMLFENDPFSLDVRAGVLEDAKKYGIKVVIDDKMPRDLNDISATLTKVRALKPDILTISGHTKGAVTAGRQIMELQIQVPMIAITHCESAKVIEKYGTAVEEILCPTQWAETMSYEGKYFGSARKFFDDYTAEYGSTPPYQAAQASAAILVWKEAFERANSFDTDKLRAALNATDMQTFYGGIKFDASGKNIAKPMALRQIQGGQLHVVAPSKFAAKALVHPRQVAY
jgi:branched-chain amino acid transport system substrate-binding protein